MDEDSTSESPETKPNSRSWLTKMLGPALLSMAAFTTPVQSATPRPAAKPEAKTTIVSTHVNPRNKQDFIPGKKGGDSLTSNVMHYFHLAEQARSKKDATGFEKHFYAGMEKLFSVTEKAVPHVYPDSNNFKTIGIGFNMEIPHEKGKPGDGKSREKWKKIFGTHGPDFDACKNGKRTLTDAEMKVLYTGMLKDSENYLRTLFNKTAKELAKAHPNNHYQNYDELPANQRAALLHVHYQSPKTAREQLIPHLAANNVKGASAALMSDKKTPRYANRRNIENALFTAVSYTVPGSAVPDKLKEMVKDAKWDKKSIIHSYGMTDDQQSRVGKELSGKQANFLVKTYGNKTYGEKPQTHVGKLGKVEHTKPKPGRGI